MSPTPSSSRIALISRAASRNSVRSAPTAPRMPSMPARQWSWCEPRRMQPVMLRRRAEIPDVRIAVAGEQRVARQLVARPLADDGARRVADVVLVEAQQRAEPRVRERRARAREAVVVQPAEIDALLEVDLRVARRLQRAIPAVMRIDVVGPDDLRLGALPSWPSRFSRRRSALAERLFVVREIDVFRRIGRASSAVRRTCCAAPAPCGCRRCRARRRA